MTIVKRLACGQPTTRRIGNSSRAKPRDILSLSLERYTHTHTRAREIRARVFATTISTVLRIFKRALINEYPGTTLALSIFKCLLTKHLLFFFFFFPLAVDGHVESENGTEGRKMWSRGRERKSRGKYSGSPLRRRRFTRNSLRYICISLCISSDGPQATMKIESTPGSIPYPRCVCTVNELGGQRDVIMRGVS